MKITSLTDKIRNAVNEYRTQEDSFSIETDSALVDFIRSAVPLVFMQVPLVYLSPNMKVSENEPSFKTRPDGRFVAIISLPDNFVRVARITSDSLKNAIYKAYNVDSEEYYAQYTEAEGVGAGTVSPKAFLSIDDVTGKGTVEIHSFADYNPAITFAYISEPEITDTDIILDDRLDKSLAYYAASLYLQSVNDATGSQAAAEIAKTLVQTLINS